MDPNIQSQQPNAPTQPTDAQQVTTHNSNQQANNQAQPQTPEKQNIEKKSWNKLSIYSVLLFILSLFFLYMADGSSNGAPGSGVLVALWALSSYIFSYSFSIIALKQISKTRQKGRLIAVLVLTLTPIIVVLILK